jgi:hypothetical protein
MFMGCKAWALIAAVSNFVCIFRQDSGVCLQYLCRFGFVGAS